MSLAEGTIVASRFVIETFAGKGGMGTVFRAKDLESGDTVALKLLRPSAKPGDAQGGRPDLTETQRFLREAKVLSDLRHPGIVSYIAHGLTLEGLPFIAMEWLAGEDLAQRLRSQGLSLADCMTMLRCLAEALGLAHRRGVIHRDIKPSNLFLREGRVDRVALLDFGIARRTSAERTQVITQTGVLVGTPEYMAPEQARGARELTPATDIFSLGCVTFECLTRRPPFVAEHFAALLAKILFDEAPALRSVRPELPDAVAWLVERMLAKDPSRRIQDADTLLMALDAVGDLPDLGAASASSFSPVSSLATSEQCLVSVIIASERTTSATQPTLDLRQASLRDARVISLRTGLSIFGAQIENLADGSLVATLTQPIRGAATDLAAQAARCALYIRERWPEARVVLATGRGLIGARLPMGEALDRAGRILQGVTESDDDASAAKDAVWMDDVTAGLLGPSFRGERFASGRHVLLGEKLDADESRLLLGKPTPCVGREHELNLLESALNYVTDEGAARALLVTAAPGMGKSRLRHEFLRRLASRGSEVEILIGRGDAMSAGSSFGLMSRALLRLCGITNGDAPADQRKKLSARVSRSLPAADVSRVTAFLGEMCGVAYSSDDNVQLRAARNDPKLMSDQITRALVAFLRAECEAHTVLIVLEDMHWGDAPTVKLVDAALRELADAPLLVLALARPEVKELFPSLWTDKMQEVPLSRLSRKACERLAREVLGKQVGTEDLGRIVAQAAGNALFLEELLRAAVEGKGDELPETVLAMLQARLSRLDPGARRVLRAASIFGQTFWQGGVVALLGEDDDRRAVEGWLQHLVEGEIIQPNLESRFPDERQYSFRHALVRDAAYSLLTDEDGKLGHRLAGKYLEALGERDALALAEHFQRGDDKLSAVPHLARAANQALDASDLEAAQLRAERAITCGAEGEQLGILRGVQGWVSFWRAKLQEAYPLGLSALPLLPVGSYYWCRGIGNVFMTGGLIGKLGELASWIEVFAQTEPAPEARTPYIEAASILATVFSLTGQRARAYALLGRVDQVGSFVEASDATARGWMRHAHNWHIRFLEPEPWRAFVTATEAAQAFEEAGDRRMNAVELVYLGIAHWDLGDLALGEATLRRAMTTGTQLNEILVLRLARIYLALLLMERGDPASLDEVHELATAVTTTIPNTYYAGLAHCALAEEQVARGALEAAEVEARSALRTLQVAAPLRPLADAVLGRVLMAQGRADEARAQTDDGLVLVGRLGGTGRKEMKLRLRAAEARLATGDEEATREALIEARAALEARAATIPDPALRARYIEEVPDNAALLALCGAHGAPAG
jgi:eukaryotic-like serine/threonine-protein kinase